jgi:ferredoxin-NADP reductase
MECEEHQMATYEISLLKREEIAAGTMAFHFTRPEHFTFKPGQAVDIILTDPRIPAIEVGRHTFSLVTTPVENELVIATRMRDSLYKRVLRALDIGAVVKMEGAFGSLTLHSDVKRAAVFIAGGIGVTPFMSILRTSATGAQERDFILVYSNRRPEDAAFLGELKELERKNKRFTLVATMTGMSQSASPWDGRVGEISPGLIKNIESNHVAPIYYLAGPPGMVESMQGMLNNMGINDDDIRSEGFYGY